MCFQALILELNSDYFFLFSFHSQKSARGNSPPASTTNGSETVSGDGPVGMDTSWLPNFLSGDSPNALSCSVWQFTLILSTISCLFLSLVH